MPVNFSLWLICPSTNSVREKHRQAQTLPLLSVSERVPVAAGVSVWVGGLGKLCVGECLNLMGL